MCPSEKKIEIKQALRVNWGCTSGKEFGLCKATATFQRLVAQVLTNVTKKCGNLIMCYVGRPYKETRRGLHLHELG